MSARPRPAILDITRLAIRAGRGPLTGIDRVELAYLRHLVASPAPVFFLMRWAGRPHLLDRIGGLALLRWAEGSEPLPALPMLVRLAGAEGQQTATSLALARLAMASGSGVAAAMARFCSGGVYLNVGHTNLTDETFAMVGSVAGLERWVMIHDMIPLDHPGYSGPQAPETFRTAFEAALRSADQFLCPSESTAAQIRHWAARSGHEVTIRVAPLGVSPPPASGAADDLLTPGTQYFLALGTIEPRKDHALLLDLWDSLEDGPDTPVLVIAGKRGWRSEALFGRLDSMKSSGKRIVERSGLPDTAIGTLMRNARALLAPSRVEGFGLPVAEAAAVGTPVLATDLPVTREILGNYPRYLPAGCLASWRAAVLDLMKNPVNRQPLRLPGWTEHFNRVFNSCS